MTEQKLATCHCVIGHPKKPKFLAIRHDTGWQPPILKFPPGRADYKAAMITDGMQRKYGLKTRVLRPLISTPNYHCIELELSNRSSNKNIQAVWVDREQYLLARNEGRASADPFEEWFEERERGAVPALRSPWQVPGWFRQADHWIHFQLDSLGIQVRGEVQQFRVGWNASCLLRVPSSSGLIYFKAGYAKPPTEAKLTVALAAQWPAHIVKPLAVDIRRNWLLNLDFSPEGGPALDSAELPGFARALATLQVESVAGIGDWQALGVPRHDLDTMLQWIERKHELLQLSQEGYDRLSDTELAAISESLGRVAGWCRQLRDFNLPNTLVHKDFRPDHLVLQDGAHRIIDWTDVVIGFPFQSLARLLSQNRPAEAVNPAKLPAAPVDEIQLQAMKKAYLEAFLPFAPMERLEEALALSCKLHAFWKYCDTRHELDWTEKGSPGYKRWSAQMQNTARQIIAEASDVAS